MTHTTSDAAALAARLVQARKALEAASEVNTRAIYSSSHAVGSPKWHGEVTRAHDELQAARRECKAAEQWASDLLHESATPEPPAEVAAVSGFGPRYRHVSEIERQYQEAHQLRRDIERGDV